MSQYYDIDDRTLWNPSNGASRLFRRQVAVFEAELGLPSGIGPMLADESALDPTAFTVFVNALLARHRRTSHQVIAALSDGFVSTVLVLAERAGIAVDWSGGDGAREGGLRDVQAPSPVWPESGDAWAAGLRERARELGRAMPR